MATIDGIIRDPVKRPFRKAQIKRRQVSDGLYEASWFDITDYIERWGVLQTSVDDVKLNQFIHSGIKLTVKNDFGEFNPEHEGGSLFNGFLTRYRTLLRIQAGYTDGSGNSFPTDTTQGIFILDGEIKIDPNKNSVILNGKSIISPLRETRAVEVDGITASMTASEIVEKIRDATDGSTNVLFRQFISSTSWNIQSTTNIITGLGTSTSLEDFSAWDLMVKLAEVEGFVIHATRTGGITFSDRLPNTTASQFSFYGAGFRRPNVVKMKDAKEAVNKLFTHIRFKYLEDDTATSFIESGTETTIDPTSLEWKFGRNTLELDNTFFDSTKTVQNIVSKLSDEFSNLRTEVTIDAEFIPHLEILDRVDVSYNQLSINSQYIWDAWDWADSATSLATELYWASETSASITYNQKGFKILSRKTNLDNFTTSFVLREVEG